MNYRPWVFLIVLLASTLVRGSSAEETAKRAAAKTYYKTANLESFWKDKLTELAEAVPGAERENYLASIKPWLWRNYYRYRRYSISSSWSLPCK